MSEKISKEYSNQMLATFPSIQDSANLLPKIIYFVLCTMIDCHIIANSILSFIHGALTLLFFLLENVFAFSLKIYL